MTLESILLAVVGTETLLAAWLLKTLYHFMKDELHEHDKKIEQHSRLFAQYQVAYPLPPHRRFDD